MLPLTCADSTPLNASYFFKKCFYSCAFSLVFIFIHMLKFLSKPIFVQYFVFRLLNEESGGQTILHWAIWQTFQTKNWSKNVHSHHGTNFQLKIKECHTLSSFDSFCTTSFFKFSEACVAVFLISNGQTLPSTQKKQEALSSFYYFQKTFEMFFKSTPDSGCTFHPTSTDCTCPTASFARVCTFLRM